MDKSQLMNEILMQCRANGIPTTGDMFFSLAFRSKAELRKICQEIGLKV